MESQGGQGTGGGGGTDTTAEGEDEDSSSSSSYQLQNQAHLRPLLDDDNNQNVLENFVADQENEKPDDGESVSNKNGSNEKEQTLEQFRQQWRSELQKAAPSSTSISRDSSPTISSASTSRDRKHSTTPDVQGVLVCGEVTKVDGVFENASRLFQNGIEFERKGQMYEAIRSYRQALLLVPDIEKRLLISSVSSNTNAGKTYAMVASNSAEGKRYNDHDDIPGNLSMVTTDELLEIFRHRLFITNGGKAICSPRGSNINDDGNEEEQENEIVKVDEKEYTIHISDLPTEVIMQIFKWVISSELDLRQLEQLSMVCCGFYILARDPELWRLVCSKIWGVRTGILDPVYPSWRQMYIDRPHLWYNGVYISKITYVRHGETAYQDQFYRPWHLVVYYRYLRFFADGTMVMVTTPDEPSTVVPFLKSRQPRLQGIVKGTYRLVGHDCIAGVLTRKNINDSTSSPYIRNRYAKQPNDLMESVFSLILNINSVKRRRHTQLIWSNYEVTARYRNGQTSTSTFDLCDQKFPPLNFSRVKSFSAYSDSPLK